MTLYERDEAQRNWLEGYKAGKAEAEAEHDRLLLERDRHYATALRLQNRVLELCAERDRYKRDAELAWAAGLFDGEGSFMVVNNNRPNRYPKARAVLSMSDLDTVERFARVIGVGSVTGPEHRERRRPMWRWSINRYEAVKVIADAFWPWLSERKREQAEAALSAHHHNAGRGTRRYVPPPIPARSCSHCDIYREALERIARGNGLSAEGHPMAMSGWAAFGIARAALEPTDPAAARAAANPKE